MNISRRYLIQSVGALPRPPLPWRGFRTSSPPQNRGDEAMGGKRPLAPGGLSNALPDKGNFVASKAYI